MSTHPEDIRRDIERTRAELSDNVNALGDSARPGNMVREQVDDVRAGMRGLKERIFGSDTDPYDDGTVGRIGALAGSALTESRDAVADAPHRVTSATRGNPIAAGIIAAGLGALIGGLIPSTSMERQRARQLKAAAEPALEEIKELAAEAQEHLQPLAMDAVEQVKAAAQEAGAHVAADARQAKDEITQQAQSSADAVSGKTDTTGPVQGSQL